MHILDIQGIRTVNSDHQRALKGSKEFQKEDERLIIVQNIKAVDHAVISIDEDRTVCATIKSVHETFSKDYQIGFANGGDQNNDTIPERAICDKLGVVLIDGWVIKFKAAAGYLKTFRSRFVMRPHN